MSRLSDFCEIPVKDQFSDHGLYILALDHVRELKFSSIVHVIPVNKLNWHA